MIKGERIIDYDEDEIDPDQGQCCLRAGHLAVSSILLAVLSGAALVGSHYDEKLAVVRTPSSAILGLSIFVAVVTSLVAFFVECRLQETSAVCRALYFIVCCCCIDDIDKQDLAQRVREKKNGYDNAGLAGSKSNSPEKNSNVVVYAPAKMSRKETDDKSAPVCPV